MVDGGLEHFAFRAEPEAIVEQLRIFGRQFVLQMRGAAIEGDLFDAAMRHVQDGAARCFVHAAAFHADEAVFDEIEAADAVALAQFIEFCQQVGGGQGHAIDGDRIPGFEVHGDVLGGIGGAFRAVGARIDKVRNLGPGVFEDLALAAGVEEVGVGGERRFAALVLGDGDLMLFGEGDQLFPAVEVPFAPRGDDADVGSKGVIAQFEPHLVVALAGGTMADGVGTDLPGNLDLFLGDERPGNRSAEQIKPFVQGVGAHHREDIVADELLAQVFDEDMLGLDAHHHRLGARRLQFLALPEIGGEGDDFAAIGLLQPFEDDAGVEATRIGEDDAVDGGGAGGLGHGGTFCCAAGAIAARLRRGNAPISAAG